MTEESSYLERRNWKDVKSGGVQLFPLPVIHKGPVYRDAITQRICPDRSEAVRLGHLTPDLVDCLRK
jgi:hypothetical protein